MSTANTTHNGQTDQTVRTTIQMRIYQMMKSPCFKSLSCKICNFSFTSSDILFERHAKEANHMEFIRLIVFCCMIEKFPFISFIISHRPFASFVPEKKGFSINLTELSFLLSLFLSLFHLTLIINIFVFDRFICIISHNVLHVDDFRWMLQTEMHFTI